MGRSLSQGLGIITEKLSTQLFGDTICGHVNKDVWKPTIAKKLHAEQAFDNAVDKLAVKVVKNNEKLPFTSRVLANFARSGKIHVCVEVTGRHCKLLCGGMEIPCRLMFSCSSKVKIA